MTTLHVTRTEPAGPVLADAVRRLRSAPWLAVPLGLVLAGPATVVAAVFTGDARLEYAALSTVGLSAIVLLAASVAVGRRFRRTPTAPDDDPHPIDVHVETPRPAKAHSPAGQRVHVLATALRIVDSEWVRRDVVSMVVLAAAATCAVGVAAALRSAAIVPLFALTLWALFVPIVADWALGFPRTRRVAVDLPWDDVALAETDGKGTFRVVPADGSDAFVLTAKYSHRERLTAAFAQRLGERFRTVAGPVDWLLPPPMPVSDEDAEAGVAELALRRLRGQRTLLVLTSVLVLALATYGVGTLLDSPRIRLGAAVAATVAGMVVMFVSPRKQNAWRRIAPAADDAPDPVPVRWTNAPGWFGPPGHGAHVLAASFRVVRHEWEMWDLLVVGACGLAAAWVPSGLGGRSWEFALYTAFGAMGIFGALGIPRRRRIVADIPWDEITSVEVRKTQFEVRSRLPEPADLVRLEAKFSARERLTAALLERLGDRVQVDVRYPADETVPKTRREPTPEDLAAKARAVRDLAGRGGADRPRP